MPFISTEQSSLRFRNHTSHNASEAPTVPKHLELLVIYELLLAWFQGDFNPIEKHDESKLDHFPIFGVKIDS